MLIDNVTLIIKAGDGGNGAASLRRSSVNSHGGPDGGDGGNGGDISFRGSANVNDLREFRYKKAIRGNDGGHGTKHNGFGRNGSHIEVLLPLGTRVTDTQSGEVIEIDNDTKPITVVRGGKGGKGNVSFKSATNQTPRNRELGGLGQSRTVFLELRLIAEIGLIGLPNAGKSSLLTVLTNATPAIGAYPFTTLEPNIGMFGRHPIADIPGLIEGAARGVGLGVTFLKHIEKTKILIHCIDVTSSDPLAAYDTVRTEFRQYNPMLLEKPELVYLNKTDLSDEGAVERVRKLFAGRNLRVCTGSVNDELSIRMLKGVIADMLRESAN